MERQGEAVERHRKNQRCWGSRVSRETPAEWEPEDGGDCSRLFQVASSSREDLERSWASWEPAYRGNDYWVRMS